jgi:hypothetical protein
VILFLKRRKREEMEQDDEIKKLKILFFSFHHKMMKERGWEMWVIWNASHVHRPTTTRHSSRQVQTRPTRLRRIFTPSRQDPKLMGQFNFQQSETKPTKKEHQVFA